MWVQLGVRFGSLAGFFHRPPPSNRSRFFLGCLRRVSFGATATRSRRHEGIGLTGGQFNCAAEIASEMDFRKDSQRHFLRCKISARLLMGNSIAPLSFHLRWIFSKGAKSPDMSQNSARFWARFSAAQSNCAPGCLIDSSATLVVRGRGKDEGQEGLL